MSTPAAMLAVQIGGLALGAYGAYEGYSSARQASKAQADQAMLNSKAAMDAANEALAAGMKEANRQMERNKNLIGEATARYAGSGVLLTDTPAQKLGGMEETAYAEYKDIADSAILQWEHGRQTAEAIARGGSYESKYTKQKGVATLITGGSQLAWTASQGKWKLGE